ncbi:MAG: septation ring formation regulator EzrA [Bacilli bacterium]|nr:septation ring formation regulator EzrA [Bacilli bacterium]
MTRTVYILIGILYYIVSVFLIVLVLNLINKKNKKKYLDNISSLERDKNLIINASILSELNKVEALVNNENLQKKYDGWKERFKTIKEDDIPRITNSLIEIEDIFNNKDYKNLKNKIAEIEMEITYVKTKANFLLDEVREITLSEERNRETITKLKSTYRDVKDKYNNNKEAYEMVSSPLELQFENLDKLFSTFEMAMDQNAYQEVGKIVKAIGDIVGNLKLVIEEAPTIILIGQTIIPKKIEDIEIISDKLESEGYNLDYLNIQYNITEANKKIQDIFQRLNVLNLEDSVFELKTMLDYFESLYNDFDKEKIAKKIFEDYTRSIILKASKLEKINNELYRKIDDIKYSYDLTDDDVLVIDEIRNELIAIRSSYDRTINVHRSRTNSFSRLAKEMELINVKLTKTEEKLDGALRSLGSLKEDEQRAREQLTEIKNILLTAKDKINTYKLPVVPKHYYVELSEATMAINEMVKELDKRPISIKTLNTRVDTARDLVLKLYNTTNETVKTAKMAEAAIVYGNRYRPVNKEVDFGLTKAENSFMKGNFKLSLENAINAINIVEPGIHKRLIDEYQA